ncbi:MAG TPA: carbohydrate porin [Kofleriaceae bacterium]
MVRACLALVVVLTAGAARAQTAPDSAWTSMGELSDRGYHALDDETWNIYGQLTYISSWKLPFSAPYTNLNGSPNSLLPTAERSFTGTFTLFFGLRIWKQLEVYFVPEVVSERGFSDLHGLGGSIQNFELQKSGSTTPQLYRSRLYLRDTFGLGGDRQHKDSGQQQLGETVEGRRVVITAGNFSVLDLFDKSGVTGDPRQTLFNMAFMTHSSWDFAADARGYSWGGAAELYWDAWAARISRMAPPQQPNTLPIDFHVWRDYSDSLELEHDHTLFGMPGAVRLLGYRNREVTGRFDDAIAAFEANPADNAANCGANFNYGSTNANAPDLCWVRKPNTKLGAGINVEQFVAKDVGIFMRAMYSDGETEVDAFNSADRDFSIGSVAKGTLWGRHVDNAGIGFGLSGISKIHAQYLQMGGVDGFVGDGDLHEGAEGVLEVFYSANLLRAIWISGDYQHIWNPGFNRDRGPVDVLGARVHAEF